VTQSNTNRFEICHKHPIINRHIFQNFMSTSYSSVELSWVPEGYLAIRGPNDRCYVVPEFMVMTLVHAFEACQKKVEMDTDKAAGTVGYLFFIFFKRTASECRDSIFIVFFFFRRHPFFSASSFISAIFSYF